MTNTQLLSNVKFSSERGAALVTMLLISTLMLIAGGALIVTTSMTAGNTVDSASETQAYYAAESGAQAVLHVLRGNGNANPVPTPTPNGSIADENKISFSRAVSAATSNVSGDTSSAARLSRWLSYSSTYTDRVPLTDSYSPITGMAYSAAVSDPDNSAQVIFSTSGLFDNGTSTKQFGSGNTRVTLTYQPQSSTTINSSGSSTLGAIGISNVGSNGNTSSNVPFSLTITQTAPYSTSYTISCTLSWTITSTTSLITVTFPTTENNLAGTSYKRFTATATTNGSTYIPISVTAPEPNRVLVRLNGYGPRAAQKQLQMIVSRFAFDLSAPSTLTLRSADDGSVVTFNAGSSSQYLYSGYDHAGGQNLSAVGVTSTPDYNYLTSLTLPAGQVMGTPSSVQKIDISNLPYWLQNADAARVFVSDVRTTSINESRYFTTSSPPGSFGTPTQPLFTFVDGDADLPPAGGAGLLVVTGTLYLRGSSEFSGLILVVGGGQIIRDGGGNGNTYGALLVARFGSTGNFLAPTFYSNGSGTSSIQYDSDWVRRALAVAGPRALGISEY